MDDKTRTDYGKNQNPPGKNTNEQNFGSGNFDFLLDNLRIKCYTMLILGVKDYAIFKKVLADSDDAGGMEPHFNFARWRSGGFLFSGASRRGV